MKHKLKVGDLSNSRSSDSFDVANPSTYEPPVPEEESKSLSSFMDGRGVLEETEDEETEDKEVNVSEPISYSEEELEDIVKNIAGGFYGSYISKFHPNQLEKGGDGIRRKAAYELISFATILLQELKKGK